MKFEFSKQIFEKHSNIKYYENSSSGGQVRTDWQTGVMKLMVAFHIKTHWTQKGPRNTLGYSRWPNKNEICAILGLYQRGWVVCCRILGQRVSSNPTAWPSKMGPIGCPETSVTNYQSTQRQSQKSGDLTDPAPEAGNYTFLSDVAHKVSVLSFYCMQNTRDKVITKLIGNSLEILIWVGCPQDG
jgi:hypothetical protein